MNILPKILISGLFLSVFFFVPSDILAVETYQYSDLLFADNFDDGNFDGWSDEDGSGGWSVDSGNLLGVRTSSVEGGRLTHSANWADFALEVDVNKNGGIDNGIGFRRSGGNGYDLNLRHGLGEYATPEIKLYKTENGVRTILYSSHQLTLNRSVWYHLKIEVVGEHIQVWLDSSLIFEFSDSGTNLKSGSISLSHWSGDYGVSISRFDNIKVTSLSKLFYPVIFIPGIGGAEFKANQDIIWSKDDGHGGTYSHAYASGEKVWVNSDEAIKLGADDYFDILKLKADGQTPESDIGLTGNLTSFGYPDIDNFFQSLGYVKGSNYFVYPYDWRKDITSTKGELDSLVETAKQASGMPKVNIVAHSMGGLVARYYIGDNSKASKINKLISLGTPHLGSVKALKTLMYGAWLAKDFYLFQLGIVPSEVRDVFQNLPSAFELLPNPDYFSFYNNSDSDHLYPFADDRDIDNNGQTGALNFNQIRTLLGNLNYNIVVFNLAQSFNSYLSPLLNQSNGVKLYHIVGSGQPTLGQIREGWLINWPLKLIPRYEEFFVNGDETVPLYSASLKSDHLDLSAGANIYYVEQKHTDLVQADGAAMQAVRAILLQGDALPVSVHSQKFSLDGLGFSIDQDVGVDLYDESGNHTGLSAQGEVENNIPGTFFESLGTTKHLFIKKSAPKVKAKITTQQKTKANIKIRNYSQDKIVQTTLYSKVALDNVTSTQISIDPTAATAPILTINDQVTAPSSSVTGEASLDNTPPTTTVSISGDKDSSGNYDSSATITLSATDSSGVLNIQYSLDNGQTLQNYSQPINLTSAGEITIILYSTDNLGNEELPQTIKVTIAPKAVSLEATALLVNLTATATTSAGIASTSSQLKALAATEQIIKSSKKSPGVVLGQSMSPGYFRENNLEFWLLLEIFLLSAGYPLLIQLEQYLFWGYIACQDLRKSQN